MIVILSACRRIEKEFQYVMLSYAKGKEFGEERPQLHAFSVTEQFALFKKSEDLRYSKQVSKSTCVV